MRLAQLVFVGLLSFAYDLNASDVLGTKNNPAIVEFEQAFTNGRTIFGSIEERMALYRVPGLSIARVKNGTLLWAKGYGVKEAGTQEFVDNDTVFSVGSISKVVTAAVSLKLTEINLLDIDVHVSQYLTRWRIPANPHSKITPVTLRQIMSHTAGFNVPGFNNFLPDSPLPTLVQILNGHAPAQNLPIEIVSQPSSEMRYSGGGTMVQELIIEEVTNKDFALVAKEQIFSSLNMLRSTFTNPLSKNHGNIAKAHDRKGDVTALPRGWESMPERAASGLWTTPSDLSKLMIMLIHSYQTKSLNGLRYLLSPKTVRDMLTPVQPGAFGLGPNLNQSGYFYHGGANNSYKAYMKASYLTGNGIAVFTNGANGADLVKEVVAVFDRLESQEY